LIKIITGGMYSGKTSEMIRLLNRAKIAGKNVVLVRPNTDNRNFLTHSGLMHDIPEIFVDTLSELPNKLEYDLVGIDEGQFFTQLPHDANFLANNGVDVIVAALNGTSEQEPFESIQGLIPFAEEIQKLNAICMECGSEYGTFSYFKKGGKTDKIKTGGVSDYAALCRKCYNKHMF